MKRKAKTDPARYLRDELYELVRTDPACFEFLQKGSLDGVWYWDIENPELEWLSPEFKALFGYRDDEIPNTSDWWQKNIHPEDLKVVLRNFQEHCHNPKHPYDQIVRYQHKDGTTVWVRCRGMAIRDEAGKPIRMLGAHTDVTALKQAEARVREINLALREKAEHLAEQAEELRQSNEALERFAYVASHDLREPLRTISSFTHLLKKDLPRDANPKLLEHMAYIEGAVARLDSLILGLLEHSRIDRAQPDIARCDLNVLVGDVLKGLQAGIEERGVQVAVTDLPAIDCDQELMGRLLQNLIQNAILHSSAQQPRVQVSAKRNGDRVVLAVDDNGDGVPADARREVFKIFRSMSAEKKGTGLGLAIAERIARHHRGKIWVEDSGLGGASFRVSLPA